MLIAIDYTNEQAVRALAPHIASLRVADMLVEVAKDHDLLQYFPVARKEWEKLPRDWIAAVLNTHSPHVFAEMLKKARDDRYQRRVLDKHAYVSMLPAVQKAFSESKAVKGKYAAVMSC